MAAFVQARNYTRGRRKPVRLVCIHAMQSTEGKQTAEDVARYFANQPLGGGRASSAHECIDAGSVVGCVRDTDTAWAASGANADGVHLELAGMSEQLTAQWEDPYSRQVLARAAKRTAFYCRKYGLPVRWLTLAQLRDGKSRGLTTHVDVTRSGIGKGDHWDPGPGFPRDLFLAMVQAEFDALGGKPWTKRRLIAVAAALSVPAAVVAGVTMVPDPAPAPNPSATVSARPTTSTASPSRPSPRPAATPSRATPTVKPKPPKATSAPAAVGRVLRYGVDGVDVRAVQKRLGVTQTGFYGRTTQRRVAAWQQRHGLRVDGEVGKQTTRSLGLRWTGRA